MGSRSLCCWYPLRRACHLYGSFSFPSLSSCWKNRLPSCQCLFAGSCRAIDGHTCHYLLAPDWILSSMGSHRSTSPSYGVQLCSLLGCQHSVIHRQLQPRRHYRLDSPALQGRSSYLLSEIFLLVDQLHFGKPYFLRSHCWHGSCLSLASVGDGIAHALSCHGLITIVVVIITEVVDEVSRRSTDVEVSLVVTITTYELSGLLRRSCWRR